MWPIFVRLHLLAKVLEGHHRTFLLQKLGNIFFFRFNFIKVNYIHLVDDLLVLQIPCITWSSLQLCVGATMLLHLSFARLNAMFGKKNIHLNHMAYAQKGGYLNHGECGDFQTCFSKGCAQERCSPLPLSTF